MDRQCAKSSGALTNTTNYSVTIIKVNTKLCLCRSVLDLECLVATSKKDIVIDGCCTINSQSVVKVNCTVNIKGAIKINRQINCQVICDGCIGIDCEDICASVTQSDVAIDLQGGLKMDSRSNVQGATNIGITVGGQDSKLIICAIGNLEILTSGIQSDVIVEDCIVIQIKRAVECYGTINIKSIIKVNGRDNIKSALNNSIAVISINFKLSDTTIIDSEDSVCLL